MTKEEVIKDLIDMAKNGVSNPLDAYCDSCSCLTCPFHNDEIGECSDQMVGELIGALIKAEEHQETNLEHYVAYYNNYDQCIYMDAVKLYNEAHRRLNNFDEAIEWLLEPYKPPKPKYKLSKFEYDLFKCYDVDQVITEFWLLDDMKSKGYFKNIPTDVTIKYILDNCEVVDE